MDVSTVLKRAAEKSGLARVRYKERDIPTSVENVVVLPFFGDRRSSFVLSSLLLRRIREELKGSKYFVLASWPGDEGMYPYVDEYWQPEDFATVERLFAECSGFSNNSSAFSLFYKSLNQYFYDLMGEQDIAPYYDNGLTSAFFERFRHVRVSLPSVPSASSLGSDMYKSLSRMESKVFVRPSKFVVSWRNGRASQFKAPREFWSAMLEFLSSEGFSPVVYSDLSSHDLSGELPGGCMHLRGMDTTRVLSVMRACGCVVDMFGGDSRYAMAARCPFLCFDERQRFGSAKEYEINDLCGRGVDKEYIFSFAALVEKGSPDVWKSNIFDHMAVRLRAVQSRMDRDSWPAPVESNEIVPYDSVRKRKLKRLGSRFVRIERD